MSNIAKSINSSHYSRDIHRFPLLIQGHNQKNCTQCWQQQKQKTEAEHEHAESRKQKQNTNMQNLNQVRL